MMARMLRNVSLVLAAVVAVVGPVARIRAADPPDASGGEPPVDWREAAKTVPPPKDYSGDFWTRPALTGDWGGARNDLAKKGLTIDLSLTQTLQGNLGGGQKFTWPYQGSTDLFINIDTGKMGLWPGGFIKIHAENRFGNANRYTAALMPGNTDSLFPVPGEDTATLSEVVYTQFLSPKFAVTMGKMQPRDTNVFSHSETEQFMGMPFVFNPALATTLPMDFLGAGIVVFPTDWLTVTALVVDSEGEANTSGFDTAFDGGTSVFNTWEFKVEPCGLPGHQRLGWTWSDRSQVLLGQNPRLILRNILMGLPPMLQRRSRDWSFLYDFDQYLYTVEDDPDRGIGVFGRFGLTDGKTNPIQHFYSIGVGGKGLIPGRANDTFGVGYYYVNLSSDLPRIIRNRTEDEQGVELYYNIAVTPWLHITPDLQIIDPVRSGLGTTTVFGVRMQMDF